MYVICPFFYKTGGTELAHQLVWALNNNGIQARITYFESRKNPAKVNPAFIRYVDTFVRINDIQDYKQNLIVVPEYCTRYLQKFKNIKKAIWWMSVDNYTQSHNIMIAYKNLGLWSVIKGLLKRRLKISLYPHFSSDVVHFYQSEYARDFLEKARIENVYRVVSSFFRKKQFAPTSDLGYISFLSALFQFTF